MRSEPRAPRSAPPLRLAPREVEAEPLPGGGWILRCPRVLAPHEPHLGHMLRRWAAERPGATFLAERAGEGWRRLSWSEALRGAEAVGQALVERGLGPEHPLAILSGNSIDHALVMLGALLAGVPVAPISPAYSLMSRDHGKLRRIFALLRPALVLASPGAPFAAALRSLDPAGPEVVAGGDPPGDVAATPLEALLATPPGPELAEAEAAVGPDTVAKILFTSGSTGLPKGVLNTQRMLCANQQMLEQCWPFVAEEPPVLVDWLPWNHTFGGNHNLNLVLKQGGTLWIDGGRPAPGLVGETLRNLREISPTLYFNVPAGYAQLVPYLEEDAELRDRFFGELRLLFYAAAALPQDLWERLEALSVRARGERVFVASGWGSTETAPLSTSVHYPIDAPGNIGLPPPGVTIKLVPSGSKLELRVRGPHVTPGYLGRPDLTAEAFDEDGFYRIGDAGRLADPGDPSRGLVFDGRVAEDFKLTSGTWVHVGAVRLDALAAAAPALQDAVVAGQDRDYVALLGWPNLRACAALCGDPDADEDPAKLIGRPEVRDCVRRGLERHNACNPGSSTRIARVLLMAEPPDIDADEVTDKGYVNQRATLEQRAALVERLYREPPDGDVLVLSERPAGGDGGV